MMDFWEQDKGEMLKFKQINSRAGKNPFERDCQFLNFGYQQKEIKMKSVLILCLCVFCLTIGSSAQKRKKNQNEAVSVATPQEPLVFSEMVYDFGKIPQGKPADHLFFIENKGLDTLLIENVQTSCGCTTPEYARNPVLKGQKTQIKVGYNAATEGYFEKSITVNYNNGQVKQLIIKGTVWKTPDQSVPSNQSLKLFNN
jgi:hypothetical protein